jgi:hypothetical protein
MRFFLFATAYQIDFEAHPASYLMGTDGFSPGIKRPECEADKSFPSSADVKIVWSYTFTLPYVFLAWCLVKQKMQLHGVIMR